MKYLVVAAISALVASPALAEDTFKLTSPDISEGQQLDNQFVLNGFGGACPPAGEVHRYQYKLHALGVEALGLDENASAALVRFMTGANTIATAELTAVYTR